MAQRLVNALGRGLGKTATDGIKNATRKATRTIPSTESFYKLGMGIGPFIRNTVQSYNSDTGSPSNSDSKKINASLGFAKENVVTQKNIAGQLSALTSIMSDIRKISLAQLNLQRASVSRGFKAGFGDRSNYLSQEQALEGGGKASVAGTGNGAKMGPSGLVSGLFNFMGNNPLLSAGILGVLGLANKKEIERFLKDSGLGPLISDTISSAKEEFKNIIVEAITNTKKEIETELKKLFNSKGREAADVATGIAKPLGGILGGGLGLKLTKKLPFPFKVAAAAAGYVLGSEATEDVGNLIRDAQFPDPSLPPEEQQKKMEAARSKLMEMGVEVGAGAAGYYGLKKGYDKIFGPKPAPAVTPTAPPGAITPPGGSSGGGRVPMNPKTIADGSYKAYQRSQAPRTFGSPYAAAEANKPSLLQRAMGSLGEYATKTKELMVKIYANLAKAISKIGLQKVTAYIAARAGIAASGLAGGPVFIVTAVLSIGWTAYDLYGFVSDLMKDIDGEDSATPARDPNGAYRGDRSNSTTPGASPQASPSATQPPGSSTLASPIAGTNALTPGSGYGMRKDPITGQDTMHKGYDYPAALGTPINAINDGEVIEVGDADPRNEGKGLGKFVKLMHEDGTISVYGHMSEQSAIKGKRIKKGDVIGKVGSSGRSTGPHLHLEIHKPDEKGKFAPIDPGKYFNNIPSSNNSTTPSVTGAANAAPGAAPESSSLNSVFAKAFGFDPSMMGNLEGVFKGQDLENLRKIQKEMNMTPPPTQQAANSPSNPNPAPGHQKTVHATQAKEKDFLHFYYDQNPQYA